MPISMHTVSVGTFLQVLPSMLGLIDKAEAHCQAQGSTDDSLTTACLAEDMWGFAKQITTVVAHSSGAIKALRAGVMNPDLSAPPTSFAELRTAVNDAIAFLQTVEPAEIDAMIGRDMRFEFGERRMDFTVEDFVLTFTLPNFYFHASTAYGILRNQGLAIGKMDFLGRPRMKG